MLGDVEVDDPPAMVDKQHEDEQDAEARGGHGEEIDADQVLDMVVEECPPGLRGRGTPSRHEAGHGTLGHLDTDLQEPHHGCAARQSGFALAIRAMRALISALMAGRPSLVRPESGVQYSRNRRRCHRRTVSGVTTTRDCLPRPRPWSARSRKVGPSCQAWAGSSFAARRRVGGARPGSRGRAGGGRRVRGGAGAGGAGK